VLLSCVGVCAVLRCVALLCWREASSCRPATLSVMNVSTYFGSGTNSVGMEAMRGSSSFWSRWSLQRLGFPCNRTGTCSRAISTSCASFPVSSAQPNHMQLLFLGYGLRVQRNSPSVTRPPNAATAKVSAPHRPSHKPAQTTDSRPPKKLESWSMQSRRSN
jgi:hypothetical protein